jgi:hypothetical protein
MSDPRNKISHRGLVPVGDGDLPFHTDNSTILYDEDEPGGSAQVGLAVTLSANNTVALTADGDAFLGELIRVEKDNKATVRTKGVVFPPAGAAATNTRGSKVVGALGPFSGGTSKGYVRSAASGTAAELVKARGMVYDNSDTDAIEIHL